MAGRIWAVGAMLAVMATAGAAVADSPYLRPNVYDATNMDRVTAEAGFTDDIFAGRVAMRSDHWNVFGPGGEVAISDVTYLNQIAVFEVMTPADGTYRISSGRREGRIAKMYMSASQGWRFVGEEAGVTVPEADQVETQSITVADVYVTRGDGREIPAARGVGVEVIPVTHPAEIVEGEDAVFQFLIDGRPVAGQAVTVFREAGRYDGRLVEADLTTGEDGRFTVRPSAPGAYLTLIRYRGEAPAGARTPYQSQSHALTFVAGAQ
ncbi:DUF4198 domain-containing protein [Brevundimonas sp.]